MPVLTLEDSEILVPNLSNKLLSVHSTSSLELLALSLLFLRLLKLDFPSTTLSLRLR